MGDFNSVTQAKSVLKKFSTLKGEDSDMAAQLLVFFSSDEVFKGALRRVSAQLWKEYQALDPDVGNRLSRLIGKYAHGKGFQLTTAEGDHKNDGRVGIRLTGKDPGFLELLRNGQIWKDSMELHHGEWSHALQWLAATQALGDKRVLHFYRTVAPEHEHKGLSLWALLCDAFEIGNKGGAEYEAEFKMNTTGFRSPQNVSDYLFGPGTPVPNHFLSHELVNHYGKRGMVLYSTVTDGHGGTKPHAKHTQARSKTIAPTGWKAQPAAKIGQDSTRQLLDLDETSAQKLAVKVRKERTVEYPRFHGVDGIWYPRV